MILPSPAPQIVHIGIINDLNGWDARAGATPLALGRELWDTYIFELLHKSATDESEIIALAEAGDYLAAAQRWFDEIGIDLGEGHSLCIHETRLAQEDASPTHHPSPAA